MSQNKEAVIEDNNYDNETSEFFEENIYYSQLYFSRFKLTNTIMTDIFRKKKKYIYILKFV